LPHDAPSQASETSAAAGWAIPITIAATATANAPQRFTEFNLHPLAAACAGSGAIYCCAASWQTPGDQP
jgi:hypothetical protein